MLAAGKRDGGRWAYGEVNSYLGRNPNDKYQSWLGIIADHAASLLVQVRDEQHTTPGRDRGSCCAWRW